MATETHRLRVLVQMPSPEDSRSQDTLTRAAAAMGIQTQLTADSRDAATVAAEAVAPGITHLLTLDPTVDMDPVAATALLSEVEKAPSALCVGSRHRPPWRREPRARLERMLLGFLFRVQTGQRVDDVTCGFRAYPLAVLQGIKCSSHGRIFETEVLVRAAWAGVELRSVPLTCALRAFRHVMPFIDRCVLWAMNVHLTMRSVVPWPHRPLRADTAPRARMTILHPLRSLRKLIVENTSPREIALAAGVGVFLGVLPLPFVHTITIIFAASFFGVNKPAAVLASQICMPPLVPALCVELGHVIRHGEFLTEVSVRTLGYEVGDRLIEWLLGSVLIAPVLAVVVALVAYGVASLMRRQITGTTGHRGIASA